jgi:hypothetical protein
MPTHPPEFWASVEAHDRLQKTKICLAEEENTFCASPIVKAHTIPRSQLRTIAQEGHVYSVSYSLADFHRKDGELKASKVGVNQFSVLNCFCAKHDKSIFADLEDQPLIYSPKQIALLHYRAVGAELYKKINAVNISEYDIGSFARTIDKRRKAILHDLHYGQRLGLADAGRAFQRAEQELRSEGRGLRALIVYFRTMPSIMTVGAFFPEFDYNSRPLHQPLGREEPCQGITFNILASFGRAALCMTWLKEEAIPQAFAESFLSQSPYLYTTLTIQTAFEHLENTCVTPGWWDNLKRVEQQALLLRMRMAGSIFEDRKSNCLSFSGVRHDDWQFDRYEFLNGDTAYETAHQP